jgi:capsular polysaccharide biosynthesis protein
VADAAAAFDFAGLARRLADHAGIAARDVHGEDAASNVAAIAQAAPPTANRSLRLRDSADVPGCATSLYAPAVQRKLRPAPRGPRPAWFAADHPVALSPALRLARLPGGYLAQLAQAPLVLTADRIVLRDYSSRYAPLLHHVETDLGALLDAAEHVAGPLFVAGDDVWPVNFSRWTLDALPRLAALRQLGGRDDVRMAVPAGPPYLRESLRLCGFDESRLVEVGPMRAVRADELLATNDRPSPPHPTFRAAPWALSWLRGTIGEGVVRAAPLRPGEGSRLYISRRATARAAMSPTRPR